MWNFIQINLYSLGINFKQSHYGVYNNLLENYNNDRLLTNENTEISGKQEQ